jgi:hypothetical protein
VLWSAAASAKATRLVILFVFLDCLSTMNGRDGCFGDPGGGMLWEFFLVQGIRSGRQAYE